jgi:ERCC4-type nuclease
VTVQQKFPAYVAFPELTAYLARWLWIGGYRTPDAVMDATDAELLKVRQIGTGSLRRIREVYPGRAVKPCSRCGGTGTLRA